MYEAFETEDVLMKELQTQYNKPWIKHRADPYVYLHTDGYYYFTASVPSYDKIIIRKAKSLDELPLANEITVWHKREKGIMSYHIWAPELHYLDDKWYIYFAAGDKDDVWAIRPYVLECNDSDPLTGRWIEKGLMERADDDHFSFEAFSLDATVFQSKGKNYFVWAEKVGVGKMISNLYIAEMESPTKLKTTQVLLTTPDYEWERRGFWVNEGPAVLKRKGKIYLFYSASDTGANYCMGMLSISEEHDILDPNNWEKERKPVLKSDREKGIYGPGHCSFTKSKDGKDIMVYHARPYEKIDGDPLYDPNRHARLMDIIWTEEDYPRLEFTLVNE
mgnify:CR=1 FL=1